jgi:putative flippase GtrA
MGVELSRIWQPPHTSVAQFSRFVTVGVSNTAISFVIYVGLLGVGVVYWISGAIGFAAGATSGYLLNRRWTFASPDTWQGRIRYVEVQVGGFLGTAGLLGVLVSWISIGRVAAYAAVIPVVTVATFLANRTWTFRDANAHHRSGS